jgi:hypothetical protein
MILAAALLLASVNPVCTPMTNANVLIVYHSDDATCTSLRYSPCTSGESVQFAAAGFLYSFGCSAHQFTWDFGDGTTLVLGEQQRHVFWSPGIYPVKLTITTPQQAFTLISDVVVANRIEPGVSFTADVRRQSLDVLFRISSIPVGSAREWHLDFGDGTTWSLVLGSGGDVVMPPDFAPPDVLHTYAHTGTYRVRLTTAAGSPTYERFVSVPASPPRSRSVRH